MAPAAERYTYRFHRDRQRVEVHFESAQAALERAMRDIETYHADPQEIRCGKVVIKNQRDIYDAWEDKYLRGEQPTI